MVVEYPGIGVDWSMPKVTVMRKKQPELGQRAETQCWFLGNRFAVACRQGRSAYEKTQKNVRRPSNEPGEETK